MRVTTTLLLCLVLCGCAESASRAPNIVYILADDLGWAELGCYGQEKIRTPNIDRMAAQGIRFTQHYAAFPVCAPSRCSLLTGRDPGHSFVRNNSEKGGWGPDATEGQRALPAGTPTIASLLKGAGYATGVTGKWGLGGPGTEGEPNAHGFDSWYGYLCQRVAHNHYPTHLWRNGVREDLDGNVWGNLTGAQYSHDLFTDEALGFIRAHRDEAFFLYVPYAIPHLALQVPDDSLAAYVGLWEDPAYDGKKGYLAHPAPRGAYAAMVSRMDRDVGRILDLLDELGLGEDTLVIFSSDNGATHDVGGADSPFFESGGPLRGRKGSVLEGGLRVPLVARWTGTIEPGRESDHVCAFWDVLPTFCDVAGVPIDGVETEGISFAPTLTGRGDQREPASLYWEFPGYGGQQAVRIGDFKGVRRAMRKGNMELRLYDLALDAGETKDVAPEHPALVERMRRIMDGEGRVASAEFPMPGLDGGGVGKRRSD